MVEALGDHGVFRPGEAEAWFEGVEEAEHLSELMMCNEALVEALGDRESFQQFREQTDFGTESSVFSP
ncbi:hypothetical protein [Haladaptatus sp. DYF46]|uniref:hypothetical protein n=1 Tax=Haladaptatus sp. DYF46 TaxID=2886041 RepID=UPI001E2BBF33|nr:hypothetical protein [Haladaptatus sp. DYF46]